MTLQAALSPGGALPARASYQADWYQKNKKRLREKARLKNTAKRYAEYKKKWYIANRDRILKEQSEKYNANPTQKKMSSRRFYWRNPDLRRAAQRDYYKNNSVACGLSSIEYKRLLKIATPKWSNRSIVLCLYTLAHIYRDAGISCEVDHIVPIRSSIVCGFHCEQNLSLLLRSDNRTKSNQFWPGKDSWI